MTRDLAVPAATGVIIGLLAAACSGAPAPPHDPAAGGGTAATADAAADVEGPAAVDQGWRPPDPDTLEPAWSGLPAAACPPGMVLVGGAGTVGMRGQPYGIVETVGLARVDAPESGCDAAVAGTPGAVACWVQTDELDPVLGPHPVDLAPYCIDAWPFPGPGASYSRDGLTPMGARRLADALASGRYGSRRLCSFSELEAAVAGLQGNRRFVYGDDAPGDRCGSDGLRLPRVGADPRCTNDETGVFEYGAVLSHWVLADAQFLAFACTDAGGGCVGAGGHRIQEGDLIVAGGTRRVLTRQAPLTPHTWHDHGQPSVEGCTGDLVWDDQPVICADPDPRYADSVGEWSLARRRQEAAWRQLVEVGRSEGLMAEVLTAALGPDWCAGQASATAP